MARFEHLSMVIFVILGLGMVMLLTSAGGALGRNVTRKAGEPAPVRFYWPHNLMMGMIFTGMMVFWWNAYPLNDLELWPDERWNLGLYLLFLFSPVLYYLIGDVLMPRHVKGNRIDLKQHYYANHRLLFSLTELLQIFSVINLLVFFDESITSTKVIGRIALILLLAPLLFTKNERVHYTVTIIFFFGFVYSLMKYHFYV